MIYVGYIDYGREGSEPPFWVSESLEDVLGNSPEFTSGKLRIQKWDNGVCEWVK